MVFIIFMQIKSSERSGAGSDDVHVPKLWYFDLLQFLEEQEVPRESTTAASLIDAMPFGYDEVRTIN